MNSPASLDLQLRSVAAKKKIRKNQTYSELNVTQILLIAIEWMDQL